jgi:DNA-binding transcriptional regulator YhcF (GntR family)
MRSIVKNSRSQTRTGSSTRVPLYQVVAKRLEDSLVSFTASPRLPPVPVLARQYGVSPATMLKALHSLREKGLLNFSRGAPVRIAGREAGCEILSSGAVRLYAGIRDDIVKGRKRGGAFLEKIISYCGEYAVSKSTVLQVFDKLRSERLVYKTGKRWIVGKPQDPDVINRHKLSSVVVVVVPNPGYWRYYLNSFYAGPMFQSLIWELEKYGIDIVVVMNERQPWTVFTGGIDDVSKLIKDFGVRYRGMLLAGELEGFAAWNEWMRVFSKDGFPVHFFCDSAEQFDSIRTIPKPPGCYCCCYDEAAVGALAADVLAGHGHKKAAYMMNRLYKNDNWMARRMEAMALRGATLGLALQRVDQDEPFWRNVASMDRLLLDLAGPAAVDRGRAEAASRVFMHYESGRDEMIAAVPSLASVLDDPSITAIVAPNDDLAANYCIWLHKMGIRPGRELSLLSFDNNSTMLPYPFSTIDLGYRTLGYQLAHLYIRDIPAHADPDGNLRSSPHLVDRGSVAMV